MGAIWSETGEYAKGVIFVLILSLADLTFLVFISKPNPPYLVYTAGSENPRT
jgi:hypothetical protein